MTIVALALAAGEGGHWALPFDALSGGDAPWLLRLYTALGVLGIAGFTFFVLMASAIFIVSGPSALFAQRRTLIFVVAIGGALAMFGLGNWKMHGELRAVVRSGLSSEEIDKEKWAVKSCGRGRYVCVDWVGKLGTARVKGYIGGSQTASDVQNSWRRAHEQGMTLQVQWGKTPNGWIAARTAATGKLKIDNGW